MRINLLYKIYCVYCIYFIVYSIYNIFDIVCIFLDYRACFNIIWREILLRGAPEKNGILYLCFDFDEIWYLYVKLNEKTDPASIFTHILVFFEKIMIFWWKKKYFFIIGHVHSIWVWNHYFWAKTNPNSVLKSWEYFQQNNGSGFFKFILAFLLWLKMHLTWKSLIFRNLPHFSVYYSIYAKTRTKITSRCFVAMCLAILKLVLFLF